MNPKQYYQQRLAQVDLLEDASQAAVVDELQALYQRLKNRSRNL